MMSPLRNLFLLLSLVTFGLTGCMAEEDYEIDEGSAEFTQCTNIAADTNQCSTSNFGIDYGVVGPKSHQFDRYSLSTAYEYFASLEVNYIGAAKVAYVIAYDENEAFEMRNGDAGVYFRRAITERGVSVEDAEKYANFVADYLAYSIRFEYSEKDGGDQFRVKFDAESSVVGSIGAISLIASVCSLNDLDEPIRCIKNVTREIIGIIVRNVADDLKNRVLESDMNRYIKDGLIWLIDKALDWATKKDFVPNDR